MPNSIIAEYQSQPWLMEPAALKAFIERVAGLPENASLLGVSVVQRPALLDVAGGVARINIRGVLLPKVASWMRLWDLNVTGYDQITEQITEASGRKDVTAIELAIDSPGGMVAGVMGAADAIFNARQSKPVTAVISNLGASAAYWLASQAQSIAAADANTLAGSIGVYSVYVDWSKFEAQAGIKVIVIRSGEHKGMGMDAITESQIAAVQEYIDATAANFIAAVARGRGRKTQDIAEQATGQLWIATTAREKGLIDAVIDGSQQNKPTGIQSKGDQSMDPIQANDVLDKAKVDAARGAQSDERIRMSQLKTAFADDPDFAIKAFTEGWSLEKAKAEYCDVLREKLKEQGKKTADKTNGAAAIPDSDTDGTTQGDFLEEAQALAAEKKITVTAAMKQLNRRKPALHAAFIRRCESEGKRMYQDAG